MTAPRIHLGPNRNPVLTQAIEQGGADIVPLDDADGLVWEAGPDTFPRALPDSVRWVQVSSAGVENWIASGVLDGDRQWTSAAGAYSRTVAQHAFMLLLAGLRDLPRQLFATSWRKDEFDPAVGSLEGSTVAIIGCGGIGRALIPFLTAAGASTIAVNRSGRNVPGAREVVTSDDVDTVWARVDHVVLAAPATPDTTHLVDSRVLAMLSPHSWVVNVARGSLIDTDAVVHALGEHRIGGVALDVTEPEPLPVGHPLWSIPNAIITPHVANPASGLTAALGAHIKANVERFCAGQTLLSTIDVDRGY